MNLRRSARWLMAALLIALCVWAAQRAARLGWASYQTMEARALLHQWIARPGPIDQQAWHRVHGSFLTALEWDPENPVYHEGFADLYLVRLPNASSGNRALMRPYLELALRHYAKAAALRPTWPYTQAGIASVKWQLGDLDAGFRHAIVQASRYGPWESAVHERLIAVGYLGWAALGATEREAIGGNVQRAHQYRPRETAALLAKLKAVAPPCSELRVEVPGACAAAASGTGAGTGAARNGGIRNPAPSQAPSQAAGSAAAR